LAAGPAVGPLRQKPATKVDKRLLAASRAHRLPNLQRQPSRMTTKFRFDQQNEWQGGPPGRPTARR